jgi:hypothetical protein
LFNTLFFFVEENKMKISKLFNILVVLALLLAAIPAMTAGAAGTITVMPSSTNGWAILPNGDVAVTTNNATGKIVSGPAGQPGGLLPGSVEFKTMSSPGGKPQLYAPSSLAGVKFADLTALSYSTYISQYASGGTWLVHTINVKIDLDGNLAGTGDQYTMVFEPCYTTICTGSIQPLNTWATWNALAPGAIWWSTGSIPGTAFTTPFGSYATLTSIYTIYPNAVVAFIVFQAGQGSGGAPWENFIGNLDGVVIGVNGGNSTYDFEPTPLDIDGPVITDVLASLNPAAVNSSVTVTANVDDTTTGGSNIASAEYSLDNGTTWSPVAASDAVFDSVSEDVTANFMASATPGVYNLCVRGTDAAGNLGAPECVMFVVYDPSGGFVTGGGWIDSPVGSVAPISALVWNQGFETSTDGWLDANSTWYGLATRVLSGTNGIASSKGSYHAIFEGDADSAPFTRFDAYRSVWPGTWTAEIDVYLDPAWASGTGFDYSVAATNSVGGHLRDFIFHVTKDTSTGKLFVAGSNNTNYAPREDLENINHYEVGSAGWYTFQHIFRDQGGALAVDLNLLDANGSLLFTETRFNAADLIPTVVGGNRYGWFTFINVGGGIAVDEHQLFMPFSPTGKATFGFVSKYKRGATVPDGNTEFQFKAGNLNFSSTSYQWLVVNQAGTNAQFKGYGTINGAGNYGFMLSATDSSPDTFRIQIWDAETEVVVYDNGTNQVIGGGSIVVHKK